jgi:hypothetical protein
MVDPHVESRMARLEKVTVNGQELPVVVRPEGRIAPSIHRPGSNSCVVQQVGLRPEILFVRFPRARAGDGGGRVEPRAKLCRLTRLERLFGGTQRHAAPQALDERTEDLQQQSRSAAELVERRGAETLLGKPVIPPPFECPWHGRCSSRQPSSLAALLPCCNPMPMKRPHKHQNGNASGSQFLRVALPFFVGWAHIALCMEPAGVEPVGDRNIQCTVSYLL